MKHPQQRFSAEPTRDGTLYTDHLTGNSLLRTSTEWRIQGAGVDDIFSAIAALVEFRNYVARTDYVNH